MKGKWMPVIITSILILLLLPSSSGAWLSGHHDFQNTNFTSDYGPNPPLGILWKVNRAVFETDFLFNTPPLVHGNYVYDGAYSLSAYNKSNGKMLWNAKTGQPMDMIYYKNTVYVITGYAAHDSDSGVWAVNATTGKIKWKFVSDSMDNMSFSRNGFIWNDKLVVAIGNGWGNYTGGCYSNLTMSVGFFNLKNGKMTTYKIGAVHWVLPEIRAAYGYGNIYIDLPNYVYAVNLTTLKVLWKIKIFTGGRGFVRATIIVGHRKVFVPEKNYRWWNGNDSIVAINAFTGKILWKKITYYGSSDGTMFSYSPKYDEIFTLIRANETKFKWEGDTYYNYNLTALNGTTGKVVWATHDSKWIFGTVSIVPTPNRLYVDSREYIKGTDDFETTREVERVYNITNGKLICIFTVFKIDLPTAYERYPQISVSDGVIYIADNSYLIAIGHVDAGDSNNLYMSAGVITGIALAAIIAGVFIVRKRRNVKE